MRLSSRIEMTCQTCSCKFSMIKSKIKEGKGKYCSKSCQLKASNSIMHELRELNISEKEYSNFYAKVRRYGLRPQEYIDMINNIDHCQICGELMTGKYRMKDSKTNTLKTEKCIDHCHTTGKVRGVLCHDCNKGLGMFKDNILNLEKAITYLNHSIK